MSKKILVVDDEPSIIKMLGARLQASGYEVASAMDGVKGLEMARREKPDLIILDLMLPGMDGYKICALLKKDARYSKIPIVLFTARAQEKDEEMGFECGANAYLKKPFNSRELLAKIEGLLAQSPKVV